MNELSNPSDVPVTTPAGGDNPFGQIAPSMPSLGNDANAANPFSAPAQNPAANLSNEVAAPNPFAVPIQPAMPEPQAMATASFVEAQPVAQTEAPPIQPPTTSMPPVDTAPAPLQMELATMTPVPEASTADMTNPIAAMLEQQGIETPPASIYTKLPVFAYGSITEDIEDITQTFDDLRAAKADDFPDTKH